MLERFSGNREKILANFEKIFRNKRYLPIKNFSFKKLKTLSLHCRSNLSQANHLQEMSVWPKKWATNGPQGHSVAPRVVHLFAKWEVTDTALVKGHRTQTSHTILK